MKITHPMSRVKCILHSTFFILHFGKADILLPSPFGEGSGVRLKRVHYRNPIMHPKKSLSSKKVPRTKIRNTIARR